MEITEEVWNQYKHHINDHKKTDNDGNILAFSEEELRHLHIKSLLRE